MSQITSLEELSLDGFQIVKADMFIHSPRKGEPTCSIWPSKLSFSKLVLTSLNSCEYVRIEVNPKKRTLVVIPVTSNDNNSIRWIKGQKDFTVRNMESKRVGTEIYKSWSLDPNYNYRAIGRLVTCNRKVMMLFDFNNAEIWRTKKGGN